MEKDEMCLKQYIKDDAFDIMQFLKDVDIKLDMVISYCIRENLKIKLYDEIIDPIWMYLVKGFIVKQCFQTIRK